jgi:UDP-N-acetylglucosamine/UDP-N-acetylgalactosamine diphosphorylase
MESTLRSRLAEVGQEQLLRFWDDLNEAARDRLRRQIDAIDLRQLARLMGGTSDMPDWAELAQRANPPRAIQLNGADNPFSQADALRRGERALRDNQIGMLLVAGGQGSRLNFSHAKGLFQIGPISKRSLLQVLIERQLAVAQRYATRIPLYMMTSPGTHEELITFLNKHDRFGLNEADLFVFCQGVMPAVDCQNKSILLEAKGEIALSPNGHGGMLEAFVAAGCLEDADQRGLSQLFYGQIDNPLLTVCDPTLIGYHLLADSELTTQVVRKREPLEKVGNVVELNAQTQIIEYSDLPEPIARIRDENGDLRLWAGNLAVHVFGLKFLKRMAAMKDALPFHRAKKKVNYVDDDEILVEPETENAIKFERFIFDLLPAAKNALVVEAAKEEAFAPVKNAAGADSPATARQGMVRRAAELLRGAGALVDDVVVEVNPLWALDSEEASRKIQPGLHVTQPIYFH